MGGWDAYCAICGVVASELAYDPDLQEEEFTYDPAVITPDDYAWMKDIRIIGENPDLLSIDKVYLTGPAVAGDYGSYDVISPEDCPGLPEGGSTISVYICETHSGVNVPFHAPCLEIFKKFHSPAKLDVEALYQAIRPLVNGDYQNKLDIDYGPVAESQDQYWIPVRGQEACVALPSEIPSLVSHYNKLPRLPTRIIDAAPASHLISSTDDDVFNQLPNELLLLVISHLDMRSFNSFRAASRTISQLHLGASFWRNRLARDQPWLYDLPWDCEGSDVDWAAVYEHFLRRSEGSYPDKILGLVNRRRIWGLCEQISTYYLAKKEKRDRQANNIPEVLDGVTSTPLRLLISPTPRNTETATILFLSKFSEFSESSRILRVHWSAAGELHGLSVQNGQPLASNQILGSVTNSAKIDEVTLDKSQWPCGLITTSCTDGEPDDRREIIGLELVFSTGPSVKLGNQDGDRGVFPVSRGNFLVGIHGESSSEGGIAKLALLQQPVTKLSQYGEQPGTSEKLQLVSDITVAPPFLWKHALPPAALTITAFMTGYWSHDMKPDLSPMEALIFGTADDELADVTAFAADVLLGGFEVRYHSRPPRNIGPTRAAMKVLPIDGAGGERITSVTVFVNHIPQAFCFITNHGHQLVVGHSGGRGETRYPPTSENGNGLAGFYGYWTPEKRLDAVGTLLGSGLAAQELQDCNRDSQGYTWEPNAPPDDITEFGPIIGEREGSNSPLLMRSRIPGVGTIVSWLDCSHPIQAICATFCHATGEQRIPLVGIKFSYSDGTRRALGPDHLVGLDGDRPAGVLLCDCESGFTRKEDIHVKPHYTQDTWNVGAKHLEALRIWIQDEALAGLEFRAAGGEAGPQWGYCDGEVAREIQFGTGAEGCASGLKLFFNGNGRMVTRDDSVVVAIQAVKKG